MSLYLMTVYGRQEKQFKADYAKTDKKLDMVKACVRFKKLDDLPLELIGQTIAGLIPAEFIKQYEASRS